MKHQKLARFQQRCHNQGFEFELKIAPNGHCSLQIKTDSFEAMKGTILAFADALTEDHSPPATELGLAFGTPERR
jgi:hypothetical protein